MLYCFPFSRASPHPFCILHSTLYPAYTFCCVSILLSCLYNFCTSFPLFLFFHIFNCFYQDLSKFHPGGLLGNMLVWRAVNPGSIPSQGGYTVTIITIMTVPCHWIPSGMLKNLGDVDKRSSPSKVKLRGQKHDCPSMTLSG